MTNQEISATTNNKNISAHFQHETELWTFSLFNIKNPSLSTWTKTSQSTYEEQLPHSLQITHSSRTVPSTFTIKTTFTCSIHLPPPPKQPTAYLRYLSTEPCREGSNAWHIAYWPREQTFACSFCKAVLGGIAPLKPCRNFCLDGRLHRLATGGDGVGGLQNRHAQCFIFVTRGIRTSKDTWAFEF